MERDEIGRIAKELDDLLAITDKDIGKPAKSDEIEKDLAWLEQNSQDSLPAGAVTRVRQENAPPHSSAAGSARPHRSGKWFKKSKAVEDRFVSSTVSSEAQPFSPVGIAYGEPEYQKMGKMEREQEEKTGRRQEESADWKTERGPIANVGNEPEHQMPGSVYGGTEIFTSENTETRTECRQHGDTEKQVAQEQEKNVEVKTEKSCQNRVEAKAEFQDSRRSDNERADADDRQLNIPGASVKERLLGNREGEAELQQFHSAENAANQRQLDSAGSAADHQHPYAVEVIADRRQTAAVETLLDRSEPDAVESVTDRGEPDAVEPVTDRSRPGAIEPVTGRSEPDAIETLLDRRGPDAVTSSSDRRESTTSEHWAAPQPQEKTHLKEEKNFQENPAPIRYAEHPGKEDEDLVSRAVQYASEYSIRAGWMPENWEDDDLEFDADDLPDFNNMTEDDVRALYRGLPQKYQKAIYRKLPKDAREILTGPLPEDRAAGLDQRKGTDDGMAARPRSVSRAADSFDPSGTADGRKWQTGQYGSGFAGNADQRGQTAADGNGEGYTGESRWTTERKSGRPADEGYADTGFASGGSAAGRLASDGSAAGRFASGGPTAGRFVNSESAAGRLADGSSAAGWSADNGPAHGRSFIGGPDGDWRDQDQRYGRTGEGWRRGEEEGMDAPLFYEDEGRAYARGPHRPAGRSLIRPSDAMLAAFFVPVIIMVIIFVQRGIFPFGEESFLRTDMYHQYAPFFSEFQYKLTHGGSLLYSWNVGMGVNFSALYAYYLSSPLNWLVALCPKAYVIEFMTYMIVIKIGLSGLTCTYYLRKHCKTRNFGAAFFGIFYALSGYMAAYSWNIMWLDCILLLPLIVLGLERLVHEKKYFLYCITLGLSILSNYYISIMICIFLVLYFIALLIMEERKPLKEYLVNGVQFAVFSLAAGGLAAVTLLPAVFALGATASGSSTFPKDYKMYFSIFDMIARHIGNVETEIGLEHWPNIYCGVAVLMFFLLYLMCKRISMKEKMVYCGLLVFFLASFSINVLNFIWHGFHYPNSLPARQSFIYILLVLLVCYRAYCHLWEIPWRNVVLSFAGAVVFVLMAQKLVTAPHFEFIVYYVALIFLAVYTGLICLYKRGANQSVVLLLALGVVAIESAVNMTVTSVTTTSRASYVQDNRAVTEITERLKPNPTFYRVEKVDGKTKNDGAWMNFPSVSLFSSTANADLTAFFKKLGCESSTNAYSITGSTPLVNSLFAVKYTLFSEEPKDTGLINRISQSGHTYLYENVNTLPLGFMVPPGLDENWYLNSGNPADVQNDLAAVIGAMPVLEEVESQVSGSSFYFTPEMEGDYYVYVNNKSIKKVTATMGEVSKDFNNVDRGYFLKMGYLSPGEQVLLQSEEGGSDLVASAYRFSPEGLESVYEILNREPLVLDLWTDNQVGGTVSCDRDGVLYTSIPYDEGWTVYVDGREQPAGKIFDTFLSLELSAGDHTVDLVYMPAGLKEGAWITGCSAAFLLVLAVVHVIRRRKKQELRLQNEIRKRRRYR